MPVQDTNPERRNLSLTSLAFIAYYYGGGHFDNNTVQLQVISGEFSRPAVLATLAWIGFLWFLYRYWLTHAGEFANGFSHEFWQQHKSSYVARYLERQTGKHVASHEDSGHVITGLSWKGTRAVIHWLRAKDISRNADGSIQSYGIDSELDDIPLAGPRGWRVTARATLICVLRYPSFSNYAAPYCLAAIAIVGAIGRHAFACL